MKSYNKPPLTYGEQVELLESRGLIIPDESRAERHLANISYYRLSAYMLPFKVRDHDKICDTFREGVTWNMVYDLYVFDRKLRLLVFDALERLEIAVRTQIVYQLSHKYGSHWQDRPEIFKRTPPKRLKDGRLVRTDIYEEIQTFISKKLDDNRTEVFIDHYRKKYDYPRNPPSWMSVELMYFSHLSRIYSGLLYRADRSSIASYFALPPEIFGSWLHTIAYVRNLCAHHARLWNRSMSIQPAQLLYSRSLNWISRPQDVRRNRLYYFLCMLNYMLQTVNPTADFAARLKNLLQEYQGVISLDVMGFREGWQTETMWTKG